MSNVLTVAKPRPRPRTLALSLEADALALGIVAIVVAALAAITWATWGDIGRDTGYDFVAAARVAHGQLPYVDYVYYYGPLAPFALGLAVLLGGSGLGTFVAIGLVLTCAIVFATYALARTQTRPAGAALAAAATAAVAFSPTNLSFVLPHTYSESFAILLSLLFLLGLSRAAKGSPRAALGAGVAAGLVALTRPEFELAVVVAGLAWLAARYRSGAPSRAVAVRLIAPAVAIPAVVYGAFLASISPHVLLFENLYPVDTLRAGGSAIVRAQAPLTVHSVAQVLGYLVLYVVGTAALLLAARGLGRLTTRIAVATLVAASALVLAAAAVDPEAFRSKLQWVFGGAPAAAVIALGALLVVYVVKRRPAEPRELTLLATVALLAVVAAKTYSGFFFLADRAQPAVYAAPFVFVVLARLHLVDLGRTRAAAACGVAWLAILAVLCTGLTVKDARAQSESVSGPGGTMRVSAADAQLYRAAVGAIDGATKRGDSILIAPQLTELYTLTGRRDPLRQISLVPGALPKPEDERSAIATLERAKVRLVLIDRHTFAEYGQTRFGGSFDRLLDRWIQRNFVHTTRLRPGGGVDHTLDVWVRRGT
jgi:hypothetical protein